MIAEQLKIEIKQAMFAKDSVKKDILRVALAEIELSESRQKKILSDEECFNVFRKIITNNTETLKHAVNDKLIKENEILSTFLPQLLNKEQIKENLQIVLENIKQAKNDGQAVGLAMKHLKSLSLAVSGTDVGEVVKELRNDST